MGIESKVPLRHAALPSPPVPRSLNLSIPRFLCFSMHLSVSSIHLFIILLVCNPLWSFPGITCNGSPHSEGREKWKKEPATPSGTVAGLPSKGTCLGCPSSAVGSEPSARGLIDLELAPLAAVWLPWRQMPQQQHRHM